MKFVPFLTALLFLSFPVFAEDHFFDISKFGATPDDAKDDTAAIVKALEAAATAKGGVVFVPSGAFIVARQGSESPILAIPSNTTLKGIGPSSTLKFADSVNNFWRMLGTPDEGSENVMISDLHLDGSCKFKKYEKGKTPEHNHGIFLYTTKGIIENVMIRDLLVENFSGDCIGVGRGCRNITIKDVSLRNFIRQGIQMAGDENARGYLVTGCQDLEHDVITGGSTIHVEHANGLKNVIITGNRCRRSILAGGVDGIIIRDNVIDGRLVGNGNKNAVIQGNIVRGVRDSKRAVMQFGYCDGLLLRDNVVSSANEKANGIYVWGASRYNANPSRNILIADNLFRVHGTPVVLNGTENGIVRDNLNQIATEKPVEVKRTEGVEIRSNKAKPGEALFIAKPLTEEGSFTGGVEGPACDSEGNLFAVNFEKQGTIGVIQPGGEPMLFATLPEGSTGNGIRFDSKGTMFIADYPKHNILKLDPKTKEITVFAHESAMSQPNDIAIGPDDFLYASDPNWKEKTGQLWRIDPDGKITKLADKMGTTNGIEVSPDGKKLYVNESLQRNIWVFDITVDHKLENKKLLKKFSDFGFDGMRCDVKGNLYVARHGKGTIVKLSPKGIILNEIDIFGSSPTNLCFGGKDGRTIYVTEAEKKRIVTFRVDQPGQSWKLAQGRKK